MRKRVLCKYQSYHETEKRISETLNVLVFHIVLQIVRRLLQLSPPLSAQESIDLSLGVPRPLPERDVLVYQDPPGVEGGAVQAGLNGLVGGADGGVVERELIWN